MRIGFDAKRAFHNFRGLGNYSRTLLDGLSKYFPENEYFLFTPPFKDERAIAFMRTHAALKVVAPEGILKTVPSLWRSVLLANELKHRDLDIYHGLSHELPPFFHMRTKCVVTMHDLIFIRYPEFFPWIDRKIYLRKFNHAVNRADIVLAICEQTKCDLIDLLKTPEKKIVVAYQSCDPIFYADYSSAENKEVVRRYGVQNDFILSVGALEERKNQLGLIEAFKSLREDLDLVFVGKGKDYKKLMQAKLHAYGLEKRTHFLENLQHQELPHFYQAAALLAYPSFFEGFGLPIVEALFSGCPVVTSEGSCFPEAGGPKTLYINPNKADDLAQAMQRVLSNAELRQEMIQNGRDYVQRFHQAKTTQHLMGLYRGVGLRAGVTSSLSLNSN
ncbi:MAG: glycosyltransferase family 4 protein [Bdellovibrio sp.]|nr:glycosyltransferase family 4 protein [Bdellovibrio sp.]